MTKIAENKRLMFVFCWATYVVTYLNRVNFSSVMYKLSNVFEVSTAQLGFVGSLFFLTYAVGQLINGIIGDRVNPVLFIAIAISGTGIINFLISFCNSYTLLLLLWSVNGYFQSMLWGPLMRILSNRFSQDSLIKVSTGMSTSMVVGVVTSWAVFGKLFLHSKWTTYFFVPAIGAAIVGLMWILLKNEFKKQSTIPVQPPKSFKDSILALKGKRIGLVAAICLCLGLIKESLSLWSPLLLTDMLGIDVENSFIFLAIIPIANFAGIFTAGKLVKVFNNNVKKALFVLFFTAALAAAALFAVYSTSAALSVIMIAVISAMMYGCNTILLSFVPMCFKSENIVSTLVGVFDFCSYVGAAISSVFLGVALATGNYYVIFCIWVAVLSVSICMILGLKLNLIKNKVRTQIK